MIEDKDLIEIGKFQKTHALEGELNALIDIDPAYLENNNPVIVDIDGINVPFYAESLRNKGKTSFLVRLNGIKNVEEAREFVNKTIYAPEILTKEYMEQLDDDRIYLEDLIGFDIIDSVTQRSAGKITDIDDSTINAIFIIESSNGEQMIPAADDLIVDVDTKNKRIEIKIPSGLLDN